MTDNVPEVDVWGVWFISENVNYCMSTWLWECVVGVWNDCESVVFEYEVSNWMSV